MTDRTHHIEALARRCAKRGLTLRNARRLFEEMYMADMLALTGNNLAEAARRMEVHPSGISRRIGVPGVARGDLDG